METNFQKSHLAASLMGLREGSSWSSRDVIDLEKLGNTYTPFRPWQDTTSEGFSEFNIHFILY